MGLLKQTALPAESLPLDELRDHLRLGSGFGDDGLQDPVLVNLLRSAMATIEAQTAKALVSRSMTYTRMAWSQPSEQRLPVAPVSSILSVKFLTTGGGAELLSDTLWWLCKDDAQPSLIARGSSLPTPPQGAEIEIRFEAGYGLWSEVPSDLRQAVMLLTGHYYENRSATQLTAGCMPFGVTALLEPYRLRRVGFGAAQ